MSQTTAPRREMVEGRLGLIAEPFAPEDIRAGVQPAAKSYFGRAVVQDGTEEGKLKHPDAAIADLGALLGVVSATHAVVSQNDGEEPNYDAQKTVQYLRKGYIWVKIDADVAIGDAVHVLTGAGDEGKFSNTGGTDISAVARWTRGGLAADGIAQLELNLR